jgi:hypothetical protein
MGGVCPGDETTTNDELEITDADLEWLTRTHGGSPGS